MKILILNTLYAPHIGGGAEIVVRQLAEGLQRRGCGVCVLATGPTLGLHAGTEGDVRVYRAGLENLYWHYTQKRPNRLARLRWHYLDRYNSRMRQHLRQVLELERPDIVLSNNLTGWSVSAWDEISAAGLPIVQVLHDHYLLCPKDTMFANGHSCARQCLTCRALRLGHMQASAQVAAVIAVSQALLERVCAHGYFENAQRHVVHNRARPPAVVASEPRADGPLRFGYIGTLSPNKGVGWLLQQFNELGIDARLVIAGRGKLDYEAELKTLADPAKVSFVGYRDSASFLQGIDVLVVPSLWEEPFGLVAVEACASGVPVIATRRGGLPEIVVDQLNGLLCDPDEPNSLAIAMLWLYLDADLRARLASQARESVLPLLDTERMLDEYQDILLRTLQGTSARHESEPSTEPQPSPAEPAGVRQVEPVHLDRCVVAAD